MFVCVVLFCTWSLFRVWLFVSTWSPIRVVLVVLHLVSHPCYICSMYYDIRLYKLIQLNRLIHAYISRLRLCAKHSYIGLRGHGMRHAVWRGRVVPCDTMAVAVLCRVTDGRVTGGRVTGAV